MLHSLLTVLRGVDPAWCKSRMPARCMLPTILTPESDQASLVNESNLISGPLVLRSRPRLQYVQIGKESHQTTPYIPSSKGSSISPLFHASDKRIDRTKSVGQVITKVLALYIMHITSPSDKFFGLRLKGPKL
jgi:hypothetical protein